MPRYRVSGMITVGVSYLVEAEDEAEAMENTDVVFHVVVLDATGQGLGMKADLHESVQWHIDGCTIEPDDVYLDDDSVPK